MRALSASELLHIWERGPAQSPVQRALVLLATAHPDLSMAEFARLSIGQRNGLLMQLREWTFGPQLYSVATCTNCRERLELDCSVADLQAAPEVEPQEELALSAEGFEVRFRLPDSLDLMAILEGADVATARQTLLQRCLVSTQQTATKKRWRRCQSILWP